MVDIYDDELYSQWKHLVGMDLEKHQNKHNFVYSCFFVFFLKTLSFTNTII